MLCLMFLLLVQIHFASQSCKHVWSIPTLIKTSVATSVSNHLTHKNNISLLHKIDLLILVPFEYDHNIVHTIM